MDYEEVFGSAAAAAPPPPYLPNKQGFRFHKSGSVSPIPPPPNSSSTTTLSLAHSVQEHQTQTSQQQQQMQMLQLERIPSHPKLISEISSSSYSSSSTSAFGGSGGAGAGIGGEATPSGVDPKLYQIVKRITSCTPSLLISSSSSSGSKASRQSYNNNLQAVTSLVLEKHREYRRKELDWLRSGVEVALVYLGSNNHNNGGVAGSGSDNNKKRRNTSTVVPIGGGSNSFIGDTDKSQSLSPAKKQRQSSASSPNYCPSTEDNSLLSELQYSPPQSLTSSNMLNASLRNRYKDVQREREKEQQQQLIAADNENGACAQSVQDNEVNVDDSGTQQSPMETEVMTTLNDISPMNPSTTTTTNAASTTTPKKKKKTKKTPTKSSSPSDSKKKMHRMQHGGGQDEDSPYSTNAALVQPSTRPTERYSNLGGISSLLKQLRELIEYPLSHPELFLHLGVEPPRGVLLRGPPGCGKTHLAKAIAGELNVSYFQVSAPELVGGVSGESELRVRTLFESASNYAPAIIFIDEIDAIAPKRGEGSSGGGGKSMEKRIVAQLLTCMDSLHPKNTRNQSAVMVLGATNFPDAMDAALRRAGRFDREIILGAPDEKAREGILKVMTRDMRVDADLNYHVLARKTPGFVGADLRSLTKEAAVIAINRIFRTDLLSGVNSTGASTVPSGGGPTDDEAKVEGCNNAENPEGSDDAQNIDTNSNDYKSITPLTPEQLQPLYVSMSDFLLAIPHVQPSSKREGFATVPDVSWSDIGALANIREELTLSVLEPISHPERFEALGLPLPAGVLLYGPPGCGKTLLAKAIAKESGANFISVKGPELLDKYVGESERAVRVVFERARSSSPCIIFFDELDSLCPKRGSDGGSGGGGVSERVVNQLLTEMDGLDSRRSVFVIAATNRPELIDPAMLRPGRLDKLLYVPLPLPDERYSILCALSKKVKLAPDVDLHAIAHNPHATGFSGADCAALLREAGLAVLRDGVLRRTTNPNPSNNDGEADATATMEAPLQITAGHFQYAFDHVLPSVSKKDQARYDKLRDRMARARTRGGVIDSTTSSSSAGASGGDTGDTSDAENLASTK